MHTADGERAHAAGFEVRHEHAGPAEEQLRVAADGAIVSGNTPEQFGQEIRAESAMWGRVIKQAGIKLD